MVQWLPANQGTIKGFTDFPELHTLRFFARVCGFVGSQRITLINQQPSICAGLWCFTWVLCDFIDPIQQGKNSHEALVVLKRR